MATQSMQRDAEPIPGYRLIERLGRGGYGEVWKAEAPGGLFKAIKYVYGDLESAGDDNKAACQELKALHRVKTIRHPYILTIEQFREVEGQLVIVMELADRNLWDRFHECRTQGLVGIPRDELLSYLDETCEALDLMNVTHQIQHLDIKPQNLFLIGKHIKVADFGLAKDFEGIRATMTGGVTPVYAAPETFEGWVSRHCDQYSLAIVYQELLTGVRPFAGTNTRHLLMQHISAAPDVSPLPLQEREIVARALSKTPDDRFPNCTEFVKALRRSSLAPPTSTPAPPPVVIADDARTIPNYRTGKTGETVAGQPIATPPTVAANPLMLKPSSVILKGLPRLVTPGATSSTPRPPASTPSSCAPSSVTLQRPMAFETGQISRLGVAPPEKTGPGALMPVYIVGAGKAGLYVMLRLRNYLKERLGRGNFPHWKWLFIDTDAEAVAAATAAGKNAALESTEVYHARMHRPAHYLKRVGLPDPDSWMSTEMLYRIPRDPATQGIRSLGRLALLDHYPVLSQRIREDLEAFLSDDVLLEADRQTNLGIRINRPRIYLASSLCGGTGSGMLIDLAYIIRHEMRQMGFTKPQLTGLFLVPPVDRSTPKTLAAANACTTLAELHHFSQPLTCYEARFDARQPSVADPEKPFERCVFLSLPRAATGKAPHCADRAAGLIYQETLTPLGRRMDEARAAYQAKRAPLGISLQSFGFYRITWPRQQLLDTVAHRFAACLIQQWCERDVAPIRDAVAQWYSEEWEKMQLDPAALSAALEVSLCSVLNDKPESMIERELQGLPQDATAASKAELPEILLIVERILQLVGKAGKDEELEPGRVVRLLDQAIRSVTKESEVKFAKMAVHLIEKPHFRLSGAEDAIRLSTERLRKLIAQLEVENQRVEKDLEEDYYKLAALLASLTHASLYKGEKRRANAVGDLLQWLRDWPARRLHFLLNRKVVSIYRKMLGNAPEYLREVTLCRQRLTVLGEELEKMAKASAGARPSQDHPILPAACRNLLEGADRFIAAQSPETVQAFEEQLQQQLRRRLRGLVNVCLTMKESSSGLKDLLLEQTRSFADSRLGQHTPAEEFFRNQGDAQAANREILLAYDESTPEPFGPMARQEAQSLLLGVSADAFGERLQGAAQELIPEFQIEVAPSTNEIVFYREYHDLLVTDTPQAGAVAADAVRCVKKSENITTYSRTDVNWSTFLKD